MNDKKKHAFDDEVHALWRSGSSASQADEILDALDTIGASNAPLHLKERIKRAEFESNRRSWARFAIPVAVPATAVLLVALLMPPTTRHHNVSQNTLPTPTAEAAALNEADEEFVFAMLDYDLNDGAEPVEADVVDLEEIWS